MKKSLNLSIALLLITVFIVLGGCKKEQNTAYPDVTATADTIFGTLKYKQALTSGTQVVAWPFGTATIKAYAGFNDVIASAAINADGTFLLILPATLSGSYLSSLTEVANTQGGTITALPETVRFLSAIQYKVEYSDNGTPNSFTTNLFTLKADLSVEKSYFYNFYDTDGTFAGTGTDGNIYNWTFTRGWGKVESFVISNSSNAFNSKSVTSIPTTAIWLNNQ